MDNRRLTDEQVMNTLTVCVKGLLTMSSDNYEQCKHVLNAVASENGSEGIAAFTLLMYEIADMLRPLAIEMKIERTKQMENIEVREDPDDRTMEELMQYYKDNLKPQLEPMTDSEIKNMYQEIFCVVNELIFNNELPPIEIGYPSQDIREKLVHEDADAIFRFYRNKCKAPHIILGLQTLPEYGFVADDINNLFHELIHYYCYLHNIQDALKGTQYHTEQFRDAVIKFGGRCEYQDEIYGYIHTELPDTLISEIVARIHAIELNA